MSEYQIGNSLNGTWQIEFLGELSPLFMWDAAPNDIVVGLQVCMTCDLLLHIIETPSINMLPLAVYERDRPAKRLYRCDEEPEHVPGNSDASDGIHVDHHFSVEHERRFRHI